MCNYEKMEEDILNEQPYSPYKHFMFHIPEMLGTILTFTLYVTVFYAIVTASFETIAENLPTLCSKMNL